ncbi:unnamed protein product [Brachionus calyciflorus]|uniref:MARVEL domain-containing protein n=1 Tax=Brachionus calyciflorus TaxID=104777 RepID=A0A813M5Q8_9BILA|nr:unnamed protein product [Brachionus calyciflorus]
MSENTGPGFSNIHNAPSVQQPTPPNFRQRILFNRNYLLSIPGILRISLIVFQFAAWISAAAVLKPHDGDISLPPEMMATRGAYLFFSIVGFFVAILLFLLNILNIVSLGFLNRLPWNLITLSTDLLWLIPSFIVSIVAAVRETEAKNLAEPTSKAVNIGAFGSAAFFGFLCTIIYCADAALHLVPIIKRGVHSPPSYAP